MCNLITSVLESHILAMCVHAVTQSCPTLCDPMDCNPPDSSVHGIFHAEILEWLSISFYRGFSQPRIKPVSPASPALAGRFFTAEPPGKPTLSTLVRAKPVGFLTLVSCFHAGCFQMMPARLQIPDPPVSSYLLLGQLEIFFHGGPGKDE